LDATRVRSSALQRAVGDRADGDRRRALIVLLWRAGLRISEALALLESDLDRACGAVLVRREKGGKRREGRLDIVERSVSRITEGLS
jgi:site-specific recombinase XerD